MIPGQVLPLFGSLPRHDSHVLSFVRHIGSTQYCYRRREHEVEDGQYDKDVGGQFVQAHCCDVKAKRRDNFRTNESGLDIAEDNEYAG
jgi:hypothetical protein